VNVRKFCSTWLTGFALVVLLSGIPLRIWASGTATTTTLTLTSAGSAVTSLTAGSVVTLTAVVNAGSTTVNTGQVNFCDAAAAYCTGIHVLGTAQLTSAGTAVLKLVPGVGNHSYKAVFLGTPAYTKSTSSDSLLTVTGKYPTSAAIAQSGSPGSYTLTATVAGNGLAVPTGLVSFLDASNGNAVLGSASLSSVTSGLSFLNMQSLLTGNEPASVAVGDFNGDGKKDFAVTNLLDDTVTVLLGNGDGTFAAASTPATGVDPESIVVGDFNGDGNTDLAVANSADSTLTILLGNGDGTFTPAASPSTGSNPQSIAVGDFNGDGIADLAVANRSDNTVTVLLGNGDGTFTAKSVSPATGNTPVAIAVGDFNGDGKADLAVANDSDNTVTVLLGNGDGTFTAGTSPATGNSPESVIVGDFNGDGQADLAVANSADNTVTVLLGNGNGTFAAAASPSTGGAPYFVTATDFDKDGNVDLAVVNFVDSTVTILMGNGDGTFTPATALPATGANPWSIALGDFNGDGYTDIVSADLGGGTATVLLSESQTAAATVGGISISGAGPQSAVASYPGDSSFGGSVSIGTPLYAPAATPVIALPPGGYTTIQSVSITDSTAGAAIYYTTDGTTPTAASTLYAGPIAVSVSETIEAVAVVNGFAPSAVASASYMINLPAAAVPAISLASGFYPSTQTVNITDLTPGATIYYTTNGAPPTTVDAIYSAPLTVSSSETLAASAIATGYSMSGAASAQYIIGSSSTSFIYSVAGNGNAGYDGDGGVATVADLNFPVATVLDASGNLYIADSYNNRVRKVAAGTGVITTVAGNGSYGYSGDGAAATSAQLSCPASLALDSTGNLYIADSYNSVVRKVDAITGIITTYAGNGTQGYSGDGAAATNAQLNRVEGIALDGAGNLFIADSGNNLIREVAVGTKFISTVAGTGTAGYAGDGGLATAAEFYNPEGVSADSSGNIYIADTNNNVVRKVTANNGQVSTVAGDPTGLSGYSGDGGLATSATLYGPQAVTLDAAGDLFIADSHNSAIRKVTANSQFITTVAGNGSVCNPLSGDGGPATSAGLCFPTGISVDGAGNLYLADGDSERIRKVTTASLSPAAQTAAPVFSVSAGTYPNPQTVTISDATPGASIYITMDGAEPTAISSGYFGVINVSGTVTIKAIAIAPGYQQSAPVTSAYTITFPPTAVISTVAGNGVYGMSGGGVAATSANVGFPEGVVLDGAGNLYFSDIGNNVVWMVAATTGVISPVAGNGTAGYSGDGGPATSAELNYPSALALDGAGNLYIADATNNVIRTVNGSTGVITTFAGDGVGGNSGDGGLATAAEMYDPTGVALDSAGNVYIADSGNSAIRMVTASTGVISTVVGTGFFSDSGDGGPALSAGIQQPIGLAFDNSGDMFIAEESGRIREVTKATGVITTVAGNGDAGFSGDGGLATDAEISEPSLAVDAANNVYISNWPAAVRKVSATTGTITTVAGTGLWGFTGDGGSATVAALAGPAGVALDAAGNLYIADSNNSRVRKVTFPGSAATPVFSLAAGTYVGTRTVTISDSTTGAVIYYTTDGSAPTTASSVYSGGVTVSATETLQAIAVATGYTESAVASAAYTINLPAVPVITWTAPSAIPYGTALSATQLNASTPVAGTFAYTPDIGAVLGAGTQTLSVTFTPTDAVDYTSATSTVQITVNPAVLTVTAANATRIYGAVNPSFTAGISGFVNGDTQSVVGGSASLTTTATTVSAVGTYPITAAVGTLTAANYTFSFVPGTLTVTQASTSVSWAAPSAITYGAALSATQLNATSSGVAGSFAYSPVFGTKLAVGTHTLAVTFTPTDAVDYSGATSTVQITVNPAALIVTAANATRIYGTANPSFTAGISGFVNGDTQSVVSGSASLTTTATTVSAVGTYPITAAVGTLAAANYTFSFVPGTLTVTQASTSVSWVAPSAITYGTALSATQLNATSGGVAGSFAYSPALGTVLGAGAHTLSVTFTPTDAVDYTTVTTTVSLTVNKATPVVAETPSAPSITTAQALTVKVTVGSGSGTAMPTGTVTLSSGTYTAQQTLTGGLTTFSVAAGALPVGSDTLVAAYTPDTAAASNYTTATQSSIVSVSVPIGTALATVTATPSVTAITDLQTVTVNVAVTGGSGQASGTITLTSGAFSAQKAVAGGSASFTIPAGTLVSGANTLTAAYSGDPTYAIASGTTTVTVSPFVMTAPGVSPITAGSSGTSTFTLSAGSTYSGTVSMTCTLTSSPAGALSLPTCSVVPANVTLTPGGTGTTVFTVQTSAATTTALAKPLERNLWGLGGGGAVLAAVLMFGVPRRRRWISIFAFLLIAVLAGTIGCGGSSQSASSSGGGKTTPATTSGTYVFTVMGTDVANAKITTSTNVSVTVQ